MFKLLWTPEGKNDGKTYLEVMLCNGYSDGHCVIHGLDCNVSYWVRDTMSGVAEHGRHIVLPVQLAILYSSLTLALRTAVSLGHFWGQTA